ncbi:hypothetical protein E3N88_21078 [Mikania micrantha]|uniref:Poly [ADP-ribose] polymerase n=1 Tax=Mikania micrantha TaxID=192012 RepID=A0A5N6NLC4_9ASTR|nr:hypothetical protein E3N88_21078 [Mikania micrantha]
MPRSLPASVDRRISGDDDENSSSFGVDGGIYLPVIEGSGSGDRSGDDVDSSSVSDCESVVSGSRFVEPTSIEQKGLVRLDESDKLRGIIGNKFVSRLSDAGVNVQVQYIQRNMFNASGITQAKVSSFQIFAKAVERRNGGDANIKYAWFGASKDEIDKIILHGFGYDNIQKNSFHDHGIVLSADHSPLESVESATADEDGIKHILLCRVLLGKTEVVTRGSTQSHPSCDNFQSGVDDLESPKKYIIWSQQMNTHILPEFVISFKTLTSMNRYELDGAHLLRKPASPWIPIPDLIAALSKILPPKDIKKMTQFRQSYIEHKISRIDMIRGIRKVAGDRVLLMVLKDFTEQRRGNRLV